MTASQHTIAGTVLTMPVKIRKATQHTAMFSVDADAAQRLIDYSGLQVCRFLPGRAVVTLILTHFVDGDLGQYHEYSTSVMVNPPGSNAIGLAHCSRRTFIHHMLVDQAFTLEAGRTIWGLPEGHGGLHDPRWPAVRFRRQHRRPTGDRHGIPSRAAAFRRRSRHGSRSCIRVLVSRRPAARNVPARCRSTACATGQAVCGCGSAITRTRKNLRRLACRSVRWFRVRPKTSRCRSATRRRFDDDDDQARR